MRKAEKHSPSVIQEKIQYPSSPEFMKEIGLNNQTLFGKIKITMSWHVHEYIKQLHKIYPRTEWLGLCKTEKISEGHFVVTDIIHPHQRISGADVTTTDEGMDWAMEFLQEYDLDDIHKWNCVLHSHHTMWVFWSGTDDNARKELNDGRTAAFAIVTAYKGTEIFYKGCLNFYRPFPLEIDADIDIEESPTIINKNNSIDFDEIKNNMDYSLMSEFLWDSLTEQIKAYYDLEIHKKYVDFATDEVTIEKVLNSGKYDKFLLEAEKDTYKSIREKYKIKQEQLKDHIEKPKTYAYPTCQSPATSWKDYTYPKYQTSLWEEADEEMNYRTFDDIPYQSSTQESWRHYMENMVFAPEYELASRPKVLNVK